MQWGLADPLKPRKIPRITQIAKLTGGTASPQPLNKTGVSNAGGGLSSIVIHPSVRRHLVVENACIEIISHLHVMTDKA